MEIIYLIKDQGVQTNTSLMVLLQLADIQRLTDDYIIISIIVIIIIIMSQRLNTA